MLKTKKFWIFTALICIAVGILLVAAAGLAAGFQPSAFNTVHYERIETPIAESYDKIVIDALDCHVRILTKETASALPDLQELSSDTPIVLSHDSEYMVTEITNRDGTLYITRQDNRPWYAHIGIFFGDGNEGITLILDDLHFDALDVTAVSGDIWLMQEAEIKNVSFHTTSGALFAENLISETIDFASTSGDILLLSSEAESLRVQSVSGEIEISNVQAASLNAKTTSGDLSVARTVIRGTAGLDTTSGDIELEGFEAGKMEIKTISGDVEGTLSSGKTFQCKTVSGEIDIPADTPGAGICSVTTTSGDIEMEIQ